MKEITKLYENAGVLKECLSPCYINKTWRKTRDCPNCDNREYYPPFTAEKQIEILKLLCQRRFIEFGTTPDEEYFLYDNDCHQSYNQHFDEAVAKFVNMLWQNLTEGEKQQIKEILE
jgi:hypothetical protein